MPRWDKGLNVGASKRKFGSRCEAERLFRLMDIDGICHSAFLWTVRSPLFRGGRYFITTSPGLGLAKPDKSRLFFAPNCPQQTSFSVHFLFSAACELWRHSRGSIWPGGFGGRTHRRRPHSVSSPYPGKSPLPASRQRQDRPAEPLTADRERKSSAGQVQVSPSSRTMQLPSSQQQHSRRIRLAACFLCAGVMR